MRKSLWIILAVVFVAIGVPRAQAQTSVTEYRYHGNDFTDVRRPYTTSDYVGGQFDYPTLGDNLGGKTGQRIFPAFWAFGDGVNGFDQSIPGVFATFVVWTDSSGNIINWGVQVSRLGDAGVETSNYGGGGIDEGFIFDAAGIVENNPGIWSKEQITTVTPELPTGVLMSTALLAMAFWGRKRIVQALQQASWTHRSRTHH